MYTTTCVCISFHLESQNAHILLDVGSLVTFPSVHPIKWEWSTIKFSVQVLIGLDGGFSGVIKYYTTVSYHAELVASATVKNLAWICACSVQFLVQSAECGSLWAPVSSASQHCVKGIRPLALFWGCGCLKWFWVVPEGGQNSLLLSPTVL